MAERGVPRPRHVIKAMVKARSARAAKCRPITCGKWRCNLREACQANGTC